MTKYPNSACQMHRNVETSEPVCIICMGHNEDRLRGERDALKEAADRLADALGLFIADNGHLADGEDCTLAPLINALAKYREKR